MNDSYLWKPSVEGIDICVINIAEITIDYCKQCAQEINEKYIVAADGELFCSEDCLDNFMESNDISYAPHPYEDQYLSIRRDYIELLENWEERLSSTENYLEAEVDEIYEEIDKSIEEYYDFIRSEGDDGVYAWEIYQYTRKLKDLQQKIFAWRPNRKTYYWVSTELGLYGSDDELFDKITTALYLDGYGEDIIEIIKNHAHPYHWGGNFVFNCYEDALEVYEVFKPYFDKYEQEIRLEESHRCEAGCGDIVGKNDDSLFLNGFFYCYSHSECGKYGIYSEADLHMELTYIADNDAQRLDIIEGKQDWCYPFREMIKRSCRTYRVEIPDWAS
jgi:hypothetical protein